MCICMHVPLQAMRERQAAASKLLAVEEAAAMGRAAAAERAAADESAAERLRESLTAARAELAGQASAPDALWRV